MEILASVIAAIVLVVCIAQVHSTGISPKPESLPTFENNQTITPTTETPETFPTLHPSTLPPKVYPSPKLQVSPSPKPQVSQNQNIDEYVYPGSKIISSSGQNLTLTSGDDPNKVTSWYKEKIQSKNLNVNSFVTTEANDKILNKLVGDNGRVSVNVEISQEKNGSPVNITIGITSK